MKVGSSVLVFTASGTFRGRRGIITDIDRSGPWVQFEGEPRAFAFRWRDLISEESERTVGGAE